MGRTLRMAALSASLAVPAVARAEHAMAGGHHDDAPGITLGISVEAAGLDNGTYVGSYQGIAPMVAWTYGSFGGEAALGLYHLTKNGLARFGLGDATLAGHATVLATEAVRAGAAFAATVPTGSELHGFGMGHVMAMPSVWVAWRARPLTLTANAGYCRALARLDDAHAHDQPLIEPMNMQELTWSAGVDLEVGSDLRVGARTLGGIPIGAGTTRVIGAGRVAWDTSRLSTGLEIQLGLAGDPFTLRGVVDTALRF